MKSIKGCSVTPGSIVIWLSIITLCLAYGVIVGSNLVFRYLVADIYDEYWLVVLQLAIAGFGLLFLGLSLLVKKMFLRFRIDTRMYFRGVGFALLSLVLLVILKDDPLITSRYTQDDLPIPEKQSTQSYDLVVELMGGGDDPIDIDLSDFDMDKVMENPLEYEREILHKWQEIERARQIVNKLNSFDHIADLSSVDDVINHDRINLLYLSGIYGAYAALMVQKSNPQVGIGELGTWYSVVKKALPYSRFIIGKCLWMGAAKKTIGHAKNISQYSTLDHDSLYLLKNLFKPLTREEIACKTMFISELFFVTGYERAESFDDLFESLCSSITRVDICESTWNRAFLRIVARLTFRMNATENLIITMFDQMIEDGDNHPMLYEATNQFITNTRENMSYGNIGGWFLGAAQIAELPIYSKYFVPTKVQSDLLAIYLSERLGQENNIKDYYSGKSYLKTPVRYVYKSVGPDRLPDTLDDLVF